VTGKRIALVFGTRPDAIKLAPVVHAIGAAPGLEPVVITTAQHRDMLDPVLEVFEIVPDRDLDIFRPGQPLTDIAARSVALLGEALRAERPDLVLVQGDTTTTFAGALAAFYEDIPVGHVEAGLRTNDRRAPFPEEANRRLASQLTTLHFAPTERAAAALAAEGLRDGVLVTGNTVIDALRWAVASPRPPGEPALREVLDDPRRVLLVTAHRRESWGEPLRRIGRALAALAAGDPDLLVVFPIHANPLVREEIGPSLAGLANVRLLEPLPYGDFVQLMQRADLVLTDSGGIQEEAPSLGKPVLVTRDVTERPEAIEAGTALLVGTDERAIEAGVRGLLDDPRAYAAMARAANPYGDGRASARIVAAIDHWFGRGEPPQPFVYRPSTGSVR
jgi:UDP-N-acetylglucosamine 2-epimerase (non-hydrolysing)